MCICGCEEKMLKDFQKSNHCGYFGKTCIKEACGAFVTRVPLDKMESNFACGASHRPGMYCLRFKRELIPIYGREGRIF